MKKCKFTSVLVAVCMLLTSIAGTFTVNAEVTNYQNKLSTQLVEEIKSTTKDTVCVYISLLPCTSEVEIEKAVSEKYTWSNDEEYLKYYRQELSSVVGTYVQQFVDDYDNLINKIVFQPSSAEFVIVEVTKYSIEELAKIDIVRDIDLWNDKVEVICEDADDSYLTKISEELSAKMDQASIIPVYISLKPCTSEADIEKIVSEKYTWTTEDEYLKYYRKELSSVVSVYVKKFIDDNSALLDDIIFQPNSAEFVIAKATKYNIINLAKIDIVNDIDFWDDSVEVTSDNETNGLYINAFIEYSVSKYGKKSLIDGYQYNELYYHSNDNETDWILINAKYLLPEPDVETLVHIGGRNIMSGSLCAPFKCCYGIYDVEENSFYDLADLADNYSEYDGLIEILDSFQIGNKIGDTNLDGEINIIDATEIQKHIVQLVTLERKQLSVSDTNSDGEIDIRDVTIIQKLIARLIDKLG